MDVQIGVEIKQIAWDIYVLGTAVRENRTVFAFKHVCRNQSRNIDVSKTRMSSKPRQGPLGGHGSIVSALLISLDAFLGGVGTGMAGQ
jgi:hypothetical protein